VIAHVQSRTQAQKSIRRQESLCVEEKARFPTAPTNRESRRPLICKILTHGTATPRQRRPQSIHQGTARIPSACTCILPFICAVRCLSAHCPHHVACHHPPRTAFPAFAAAVCLGRISSLHATALTTHEDLIHHSHLESIQVDNLTTSNFSPPILVFFSPILTFS
jgi:hypothetical protein